jgi:putative endonuclease
LKPAGESWWLYVLECRGGVLYTGIAKDVEARFVSHLAGDGAKFTRLNRPVRILGRALLATKGQALRAELALKKLKRAEKLRWCAEGLNRFLEGHMYSNSTRVSSGQPASPSGRK